MDEIGKKNFVFNGETFLIRALSDGNRCVVQVFKNTNQVNKINYEDVLDKKDALMTVAESDVKNNINQR